MLRKTLLTFAAVIVLSAALAVPAHAQQTVSFNVGKFFAVGEDARFKGRGGCTQPCDVLAAELNGGFEDALLFNLKDFNGPTVGADWLVGVGDFIDAGVGIGYYGRSVASVSANFVEDNGNEITQTLRLRIIPISATVRFLPIGRHAVVEPYVGAGIGFYNWRYSEVGRFVNPQDLSIFGATYEQSGWSAGPMVVAGVRVPIGAFMVGGEAVYQRAKADLDTNQFLGSQILLDGWKAHVTFAVRF